MVVYSVSSSYMTIQMYYDIFINDKAHFFNTSKLYWKKLI